jgi:hypothetical protein
MNDGGAKDITCNIAGLDSKLSFKAASAAARTELFSRNQNAYNSSDEIPQKILIAGMIAGIRTGERNERGINRIQKLKQARDTTVTCYIRVCLRPLFDGVYTYYTIY